MPQFDFSSFNVLTQVFWFAICFFTLYFSMGKIILPKIQNIIKDRENDIGRNQSDAADLQKQLDEINKNANDLKDASLNNYQLSIDESNKKVIFNRENALKNLKEKIDKKTADSNKKISEFVDSSKQDCDKVIATIIESINKNIFNGSLSKEDLSKIIDNK